MDTYRTFLESHFAAGTTLDVIWIASGILVLVVVAGFLNLIAKFLIVTPITSMVRRSKIEWDDVLLENKVFKKLSHVAPAIGINWLNPFIFKGFDDIQKGIGILVNIYLILIVLWVIDSFLNAVVAVYNRSDRGKRIPLKGFVQAVKLVVYLIGFILILSIAFGKSPVYFFSGLGAITAVLLLVFKDAILGFVAGIQISVNNMVQVGDWIEMPGSNTDGDVIDVTLTTVKIQNWDKTISTIPTYSLISKSFRNWRGMSDSGGRRIKRSIKIDLNSIQFADQELLEKFQRYEILKSYLKSKLDEVSQFNDQVTADLNELINGRRLTNVGTFRAYCLAYLKNHPKVHQSGMTLLVRQLAPGTEGLPIELYFFTNDIAWVAYEDIQADIFDHLLAVVPQFNLRVYQKPSGKDLEAFAADN